MGELALELGTIMYAAAMRRAIAAASAKGSLLFIDEASITFDRDCPEIVAAYFPLVTTVNAHNRSNSHLEPI